MHALPKIDRRPLRSRSRCTVLDQIHRELEKETEVRLNDFSLIRYDLEMWCSKMETMRQAIKDS